MNAVKTPSTEVHTDSLTLWDAEFDEHRQVTQATEAIARDAFSRAVAVLVACIRSEGKLMVFGNGGSASDAQHIVAELVVRYKKDRPSIPAIALNTDSALLTACANDLGYESVFSRQVESIGRRGDTVLAISTSGMSPNVLKALKQAREQGIHSIGLSGGSGGSMAQLCDVCIVVPTTVTARIQEMHISIGHMLCKALEEQLGLVRD